MKIAIKFGDNDFSSTFIGVLETIFEIYKYNEVEPTKKQLVKLINEISYGIYIARQHDYKGEVNHFTAQERKIYLRINESKILIGKEVDDYLNADVFFNSETFILDTDLDYEGNSATYSI